MKPLKSLFTRLLFAMSFPLSLATSPLANACEIRVGWEDWAPYIYRENGELQGAEYDYLLRLSDAVGCEFIFVDLPWIRALEQLEKGNIDLLYGASFSSERHAFANFSVPYRYEEMVLITAQDQAPSDSLSWLRTQRVGLIRGFQYPEAIEKTLSHLGGGREQYVASDDQLLHMMEAGNRIDGYIVERVVAELHVAQAHKPLTITDIPGAQREPMYFMLNPKLGKDILTDINAAIDTLSYHNVD
ncbi:substrate-binding periplasmic protein [Thalassolituus sp. LLYu03]|uniref:substrate-binding periplasmic protein n=1 Tax=Thalassolituus sp. LLYu03 TaxID=3421656 RepID=UPI003D2892BE